MSKIKIHKGSSEKAIRGYQKRRVKQYRKEFGTSNGYRDAIIEDAFAFYGKDITKERAKEYEKELGKIKEVIEK